MTEELKHGKVQKPILKVVFDTNVLYNGSASDLVQLEIATLIRESTFDDLEIQWHLPEMVRHERHYQMQRRALELLPPIAKVERLLGHNLAINEQTLLESVERAIAQRQQELGLMEIQLNHQRVDWNRILLDAAYRRAPFQDGEKEKGFRDRVIVESFLQLVEDSPKKPNLCRVVLVTADKLVAQAAQDRITTSANASTLLSIEELKGLINTLVSQVDEAFIASLKPRVSTFFFEKDEKSGLFYKERVRERLIERFADELDALPPGATNRKNGTWRIHPPNFVKKNARRIQWASRISVEAEASKLTPLTTAGGVKISSLYSGENPFMTVSPPKMVKLSDMMNYQNLNIGTISSLMTNPQPTVNLKDLAISFGNETVTHRGTDIFEVLWSADVTTRRDLRRATMDELRHLGVNWEPVA
jgi:hypothetical protein